MLMTLF